jgi:uncharacterized repeat protein (TIGR01451 family)
MRVRIMHLALVPLVCLALLVTFSNSVAQTPTPPAPSEFQMAPRGAVAQGESPPGTGFVPPPMDLSHLTGQEAPEAIGDQAAPSSWDWRALGKVTPVKDQGACGACYAFAAIGDIESKMLISETVTYDFSENNAKECNWYETSDTEDGTSCSGGNYYKLASLFSKKGTVLEACDPYAASDVACNPGCPYQKTLLDWSIISGSSVPNTAVLQQYIQQYGPVYTTMYAGNEVDAWGVEFGTYSGSYVLDYSGTEKPNHAVLIVGWDDAAEGGSWIVKNSWDTDWGANGYFTITYGSASIGMHSSFMSNWQDYDTKGDIMYYDEGGWTTAYGMSDPTAWGLAKFTPGSDTTVTRVEFWTSDETTDVDVYIYDAFDGTTLSGLLASKLNNSFAEAGYHSVALDSPLEVSSGDDVVAVVKVTNDSYWYPIVADDVGPYETGRTYISSSGADGSWTDMGTDLDCDAAIRLRTHALPAPDVGVTKSVVGSDFAPGDPITFTLAIGNSGDEMAAGVVVTDIIPAEVLMPTFASTLAVTPTGVVSYVWQVEPLSASESGVITIYGWISPTLPSDFSFANQAAISDPEDTTPGNNTSSVIVGETKVYLPLVLRGYPPPPWVTIVSEDFEGSFPGGNWDVGGSDFGSGRYYWGKRNCRNNGGAYSGWSVGAGDTILSCGSNYPNNVQSWMVYGPFSLADASAAELSFDWWSDTQLDHDDFFWGASSDGSYFYGTGVSGDWSSWTTDEVLDLSAVPGLGDLTGDGSVWIMFFFDSDSSGTDRGTFVDNILLRKCVGGAGASAGVELMAPLPASGSDQTIEFTSIRLDR